MSDERPAGTKQRRGAKSMFDKREKRSDPSVVFRDDVEQDAVMDSIFRSSVDDTAKEAVAGADQAFAWRDTVDRATDFGDVPVGEGTILALRRDLRKADAAYIQMMQEVDLSAEKKDMIANQRAVGGMHRAYGGMMVMNCLSHLKGGLRPAALTNMLGAGVTMWMLSPDFRQYVGNMAAPIKDSIEKKLDTMAWKTKDQSGVTSKILQKRLEGLEYAERGYRPPYTPYSAALTQVALTERVARAMREPGADVPKIQAMYGGLMNGLYRNCEKDGLDLADVDTQSRFIVGQRIATEPAFATMFDQLAHGEYVCGPKQEVPIGNGETRLVWTGDFVTNETEGPLRKGFFTPRPPQTELEHTNAISQMVKHQLEAFSGENEDFTKFTNSLTGFGLATASFRSVTFSADDPSVQKLGIADEVKRSQTQLASMAFDGIGPEEAERIYRTAMRGALTEMSKEHGEMFDRFLESPLAEHFATVYNSALDEPGATRDLFSGAIENYRERHDEKPKSRYFSRDDGEKPRQGRKRRERPRKEKATDEPQPDDGPER